MNKGCQRQELHLAGSVFLFIGCIYAVVRFQNNALHLWFEQRLLTLTHVDLKFPFLTLSHSPTFNYDH